MLAAMLPSQGYPGTPTTWGTWIAYEDSNFIPAQISACTDLDGRLRTLFVNRSGFYYYTENSVPYRVHHPVMQSFRPFSDGGLLSEFMDTKLGSYTSNIGRDDDVSDAASLLPRRTSVYSVQGPAGTLSYGGSYAHKLPTETFGESFFPSNVYHGDSVPLGGRKVLESRSTQFLLGFSGAQGNVLAASAAPGATQNRIFLTNRTDGDVRLSYYEDQTNPPRSFNVTLSGTTGDPNWAVGRTITGGSVAVTPDRRDFYAFVTSRKAVAGGGFSLEARVWHVRTTGTTSLDGDGDTVIDLAPVETNVPFGQTYVAGSPATLTYPQILLASTGEPEWIIYSNRYNSAGYQTDVYFSKRHPASVSADPQVNLRSIASGFGATGSSFYNGATGGTAGLDRLDRLHLAYQYIAFADANDTRLGYARENATGAMEGAPLFSGKCFGAPALAVGPGEYPYIIYHGYAPGSGAFDKLVVIYPSGLKDSYRGDYEDRDKDGRIGLLEFAQGTSDIVHQSAPIGPVLSSVETSPGVRRPQLSYQLSQNAVHISEDRFQISQGNDVIEIRLGYSYNTNGLVNWNAGGYVKKSEVLSGGVRNIVMEDQINMNNVAKAFYRLQVSRTQGPP